MDASDWCDEKKDREGKEEEEDEPRVEGEVLGQLATETAACADSADVVRL